MKNTNLNSYTVTYRNPETNRQARKVVKAKTERGAMLLFKKMFGIKAICAERNLTALEKRILDAKMREARKVNGRATYFDGRTMCYCDNDGVVGMENGYTH